MVKLVTGVEGDLKAPFSIATTSRCREGTTPFPGLLHFTLDTYLILLSVKQEVINYHFKSLWYDATKDRTQVFRAIGEQSTHMVVILKSDWILIGLMARGKTLPTNRVMSLFSLIFFHQSVCSNVKTAVEGT